MRFAVRQKTLSILLKQSQVKPKGRETGPAAEHQCHLSYVSLLQKRIFTCRIYFAA
jgi:hypothetical protein